MPYPRFGYAVIGLAALTLSAWATAAELQFEVQTPAGAPMVDAIVYLTPQSPVPHGALPKSIIDQVNRQFVPRVSVVQAGTPVEFPNSDNIRHSVYSFSSAKTFTLKLYSGTPASPLVFDTAGVVVLGCNIHDRMLAWLLVVDTPYYAHTDQDGMVKLSNVPPGEYRLRAWHEPMSSETPGEIVHVDSGGAAVRKVTLDAGAPDMAGMQH